MYVHASNMICRKTITGPLPSPGIVPVQQNNLYQFSISRTATQVATSVWKTTPALVMP